MFPVPEGPSEAKIPITVRRIHLIRRPYAKRRGRRETMFDCPLSKTVKILDQAGSTSGIENLLSLRKNFRLRRRCRSYFLVYCCFPISKFPRRRRPFLNFYLPPCWWSQKARVNCSFPISKFPRRRRSFLNFHTALLMIATGAHTQTKSTSGKKICFRFAKIFAFGDGAEVIF